MRTFLKHQSYSILFHYSRRDLISLRWAFIGYVDDSYTPARVLPVTLSQIDLLDALCCLIESFLTHFQGILFTSILLKSFNHITTFQEDVDCNRGIEPIYFVSSKSLNDEDVKYQFLFFPPIHHCAIVQEDY